jgi:aldehyde dehydrogenase (NAD+)
MTTSFNYSFNTPVYKGTVDFPTGIFIDNQFRAGSKNGLIDVVNPTSGKLLTQIAEGTKEDVDAAVAAARKAFETTWGLNAPGHWRGELLNKLANLMVRDTDELSAIECIDNGKTWKWAKGTDIKFSIDTIKYFAGWADKVAGQVIETDERKLAYTRHEPMGVVGQIVPWNFPLLMVAWKIGPALATGNCIVLKPSEFTPLTAMKLCSLIVEAGFPPGVVNFVNGYGPIVGQAISEHMGIDKVSRLSAPLCPSPNYVSQVAFTGSTLVGRKVMTAAANSNLKNVTLELGGKSPSIVFADADMKKAVEWAAHGLL